MNNLILNFPLNPLGYGVVGYNIAKSLIKINKDVQIFPIGQPQLTSTAIDEIIESTIGNYDNTRDVIKIWHQHDLINRPSSTGKYYGFPIFELDTFSKFEKTNLKVPDKLFVCSNWAKQVVIDNIPEISPDNIVVAPLGVDRDIFFDININLNSTMYRFYTIGKLEYRKGHEFIVDCFNKAFSEKDDVELDMMVHNVFLQREVVEQWLSGFKNTKLGRKIKFQNPVQTQREVADFIRYNDCGLFPSRAEGWNLELLESMSCGKPVIATNYSGHTEFCNDENSYLIDIEDKEVAYDRMGGMWFKGQGSWAELDYEQEEQMITYMRKCYHDRPINKKGIETAKTFTWENTVNKILNTTRNENE